MMGVYKITNKINGMLYVGSSCDIEYRWRKHREMLSDNRHYSKHLQNSWNKYRSENFIFEMLEETSEDDLLIREQYYLDTLTPYDTKGYNTCRTAGSPLGNKHTPEAIEKIRNASKNRIVSEETRRKISEALTGKKRNPEQIKKFSEVQKKMWSELSEEESKTRRQKIKEHLSKYDKTPSEETKEKIRQSLKGRKRPKEFCEKMSKSLKGKKLPEEVKQKLREKAKMRKEQKNKMFDELGNLDENFKKQMIEAMTSVQDEQNFLIVEDKAPEDSICPNCKNNSLTIKLL